MHCMKCETKLLKRLGSKLVIQLMLLYDKVTVWSQERAIFLASATAIFMKCISRRIVKIIPSDLLQKEKNLKKYKCRSRKKLTLLNNSCFSDLRYYLCKYI